MPAFAQLEASLGLRFAEERVAGASSELLFAPLLEISAGPWSGEFFDETGSDREHLQLELRAPARGNFELIGGTRSDRFPDESLDFDALFAGLRARRKSGTWRPVASLRLIHGVDVDGFAAEVGTLVILREPVEFRRRVGRVDAVFSLEHEQLDIGSTDLDLTRAVIRLRYTISG